MDSYPINIGHYPLSVINYPLKCGTCHILRSRPRAVRDGEKDDGPADTDCRLRNFGRSLSDVYAKFQISSLRPQPSRSSLSERPRHHRPAPTPTCHRRLTPRPAPSRSGMLRLNIRLHRHRRPSSGLQQTSRSPNRKTDTRLVFNWFPHHPVQDRAGGYLSLHRGLYLA
jgi:hypothetical protein